GNIPNPEAKPSSADGTAPETVWESRTPPDNTKIGGPLGPLFGIGPLLGIGLRRARPPGGQRWAAWSGSGGESYPARPRGCGAATRVRSIFAAEGRPRLGGAPAVRRRGWCTAPG